MFTCLRGLLERVSMCMQENEKKSVFVIIFNLEFSSSNGFFFLETLCIMTNQHENPFKTTLENILHENNPFLYPLSVPS